MRSSLCYVSIYLSLYVCVVYWVHRECEQLRSRDHQTDTSPRLRLLPPHHQHHRLCHLTRPDQQPLMGLLDRRRFFDQRLHLPRGSHHTRGDLGLGGTSGEYVQFDGAAVRLVRRDDCDTDVCDERCACRWCCHHMDCTGMYMTRPT